MAASVGFIILCAFQAIGIRPIADFESGIKLASPTSSAAVTSRHEVASEEEVLNTTDLTGIDEVMKATNATKVALLDATLFKVMNQPANVGVVSEETEGIVLPNASANSFVAALQNETDPSPDEIEPDQVELMDENLDFFEAGDGGSPPCADCVGDDSVPEFGQAMGAMGWSPMYHKSTCGNVEVPAIVSPREDKGDCPAQYQALGCYLPDGKRCQKGQRGCQCYIPKGGYCHPDATGCDHYPCRPGTFCTLVQDPDWSKGASGRYRLSIVAVQGYRKTCGYCSRSALRQATEQIPYARELMDVVLGLQ